MQNAVRPHHVGLTVQDLERARAWYAEALGFELQLAFKLPGGARGAMLRSPDGARMELFEVSAPANEFGVLDHDVTLPSGEVVYNPMRVIPDDAGQAAGCEVVFTLRRRAGLDDEDFARDATLIEADLHRLKELMELGG